MKIKLYPRSENPAPLAVRNVMQIAGTYDKALCHTGTRPPTGTVMSIIGIPHRQQTISHISHHPTLATCQIMLLKRTTGAARASGN